jgi:hypothetical protein
MKNINSSMKQIAKSWAKRPNYIIFDNLSEFEFYKKWGWDEGRDSLIFDPVFSDESGAFTIEFPIEYDEEDLIKFRADVKKCYGWCDEAIDRQIESGFFSITPTAIFQRQ